MQVRTLKLFVSAGEPSGDALLASALQALRKKLSEAAHDPRELLLCGVGGPLSEAQGLVSCLRFEDLAVNGVGDVLRALPRLALAARRLEKALVAFDPDAVLLVDYPGMNVCLWRLARKLGKPVHYLAPPQLWSRRSADVLVRRYASLARGSTVQVLFPFEAALWQKTGAQVLQAHPFDTRVPDAQTSHAPRHFLLCPGSRPQVMLRNLKAYLHALRDLQNKHSAFVPAHSRITVLVPDHLRRLAEAVITAAPHTIQVIADKRRLLHQGQAPTTALCQPGTMTLELALAGIPFIAAGMVDALTLALGKYRVATPHLALPNVLLKKRLYPEWVGLASGFTGDTLARLCLELNEAQPHLAAARTDLVAAMGSGGSGYVTANSLLSMQVD